MRQSQGRSGAQVRSIFLSDAHLGWKHSQAEALLRFLQAHEPRYLYLVGDIIDGWQLRRTWRWRPACSQVIRRLLELGRCGTQIRYTPGNHDEFLRHFLADFGFLEIANEFIHRTADGQRYLVLHGDRFDRIEMQARWLSAAGAYSYDALMWLQGWVNCARRQLQLNPCNLTAHVKRRIKRAVTFISDFEQRLAAHARDRRCDGVICGHIHSPAATRWDNIQYFNTGDWVENRSALLEYNDGTLNLLQFSARPDASVNAGHVVGGFGLTRSSSQINESSIVVPQEVHTRSLD